MNNQYKRTMNACFVGYVVQAIVNNFVPLLFLTFQKSYHVPLSKITMLITINFIIQLLIDLLSAGFIDRIGYRASILLAHVCAATGLLCLAILPDLFNDTYTGILISVFIYAIGGGLIEVLVSPIAEACPTDNKETAMSLLHAFYCWGHVSVVLISTIFFQIAGISSWKILTVIWAIIPVVNGFAFARVPMNSLTEEGTVGLTLKELFSYKIFWILMIMMICSGASEQAVSQWASTFAETGLGVSKTVGDLAGPMSFAILMGTSRTFYGKYGEKINLERFMMYSVILCIASYLCISLIPVPAVGILWPGTFSKASASIKGGGTAMFALLALAGDLGCSSGPTLAGLVSSYFHDNLRIGIFAAAIFPVLLLLGLFACRKIQTKRSIGV